MKKIQDFAIGRLKVEEDFGFQKMVLAERDALQNSTDSPSELSVRATVDTSALLTASLDAFATAFDEFDAALKDSASVPSTAVAAAADDDRDDAWRGTSAYGKALLKHPTAETRDGAAEAKAIIDKYGDPTALSQAEESGVLHNLLQDLKAMTQEKRTAMSLDVWIDDLEAKEEAFIAAARQRTAEKTGRTVGVIKQKRAAADTAYRELVDTVNALTLLEGDAAYATFIDRVNVLIDQQRTVLKTRTTLNTKKREEAENEGEQGETDSPSVI